MRWHRAERWLAAATVVIVTLGGTAAAHAAQTEGTITFSRVDVSDHPDVSLEVSIPSGLSDGPVDPSEIALLENGTQIPVEVSRVPTAGLEVVLLIDTSGSMKENGAMEAAKFAATGFLSALPSDVAVGIVSFASTPTLVSPLSLDRDLLTIALGELTAKGETALYDGVVFGNTLFSAGTTDRQFILLSDGGDTVSTATVEDAVGVTAAVRTSIIELTTSESNQQSLVQMSAVGNGRLTSISDVSALGALYQDIANSLVNRYELTFTTSSNGPTDYVVNVDVSTATLSASTVIELPTAPIPTTIATPAVAATTTPSEPAAAPPPTSESVDFRPGRISPSVVATDGGSRRLLIFGAFAVFLMLTLLVFAVWPADETRRIGRRQLGIAERVRPDTPKPSVGDRLSALADRALAHQDERGRLANALDVAAISMRPGEFIVLTVAAGIFAGVVCFALAGPVGALIALVTTPLVARLVVGVKAGRRRRAFDEQLPDVLQLVTSALRSGHALPQALDAVARQAAEPARAEFGRIMFENRVGRDLGDSLQATSERMHSTPFRWIVTAIEINREVGGELAHVLTIVASTIRERHQLERQVQTLTAEGRLSAYILTALPLVMVGALGVINPDYFEPMRDSPGPLIIIASVLLLIVGWVWMQRMIKTEI